MQAFSCKAEMPADQAILSAIGNIFNVALYRKLNGLMTYRAGMKTFKSIAELYIFMDCTCFSGGLTSLNGVALSE
jgi:hypothetical protein